MKSRIQELIETTPAGQPCFRVYGGLIVDVTKVTYIGGPNIEGIKVIFTDGSSVNYIGGDREEVHRLMLKEFTALMEEMVQPIQQERGEQTHLP